MKIAQTNLVYPVQVNQASSARVHSRITIEQNSACSEIWQAIKRALNSIRDAFLKICYCSKKQSIAPPVINNVSSPQPNPPVQPLPPVPEVQEPAPALDPARRNELVQIFFRTMTAANRAELITEDESVAIAAVRNEARLAQQDAERIFQPIMALRPRGPMLWIENDDERARIRAAIRQGRIALQPLENRIQQVFQHRRPNLAATERAQTDAAEALDTAVRELGAVNDQNFARNLDFLRERAQRAKTNAVWANYHSIKFMEYVQTLLRDRVILSWEAIRGTPFRDQAGEPFTRALERGLSSEDASRARRAAESGNLEELRAIRIATEQSRDEAIAAAQEVNNLGDLALAP